ncbi:hypothetical protein BBP40_004222 [Aspergillus hancockii]|nr:hypothetical protein BBP40_004222 [Aspergillus hancockii]
MLDVHGSAVTAEPELQPRFVMTPHARNAGNDTNAVGLIPSSDLGNGSKALPEKTDLTVLDVTRNGDDDGRVATEEEVRDLLHVVDKVPARLWVICLPSILERFVWYGATDPLQNYLQNSPEGEASGALGLGQAAPSNIVNALVIGSYITTAPAAVIVDSWLGRYTIMLFAAMYCVFLFLSFSPGFCFAVCAFKTTVVPFIADQYDQNDFQVQSRKTGEKVIASRELTITYIYSVFYWAVNVVSSMADFTPLLEKYVGFWLAYLFHVVLCVRTSPTSNIMPQVAAVPRYGVAGGFRTGYAYNQALESMKTLAQALWLAMAGIGTCLALAFTPLTKSPYLVIMYAMLTGLLGGATLLLWAQSEVTDSSPWLEWMGDDCEINPGIAKGLA